MARKIVKSWSIAEKFVFEREALARFEMIKTLNRHEKAQDHRNDESKMA